MPKPTIRDLSALADHARLSHRHWIQTARNGGSGAYGPAYCLEGAATWRRRLAELLTQIRDRRRPRTASPASFRAGQALARAAARLAA